MSESQIVLTGAGGQLGLTLRRLWPDSPLSERYELVCFDVAQLDITLAERIAAMFDPGAVDHIVNAAAYTAVDKAESERDEALAVNGDGPCNLAGWAAEYDAGLIQISTDFVFDGQADKPYPPDAEPNPAGAYGATKLAGEQAVLKRLPQRGMVLRTSWLYSPFRANFVKTMLRLMQERDSLAVVNDQIGSPTSTFSLARLLLAILEQGNRGGIYHWSDAGAISWYDFALAIRDEGLEAGILEKNPRIRPIPASEYPAPAARPAYSVLDVSKTVQDYGCEPRDWRTELQRVIRQLADEHAETA